MQQYEYEIDRIIENLKLDRRKINIEFVSMGRSDGWCEYIVDLIYIKINKNLNYKQTVLALKHELKHAQQYINKKLINLPGEDCIWRGKKYSMIDPPATWKNLNAARKQFKKYQDQPWEKEARKYEQKNIFRRKLIGQVGKTKFYKV